MNDNGAKVDMPNDVESIQVKHQGDQVTVTIHGATVFEIRGPMAMAAAGAFIRCVRTNNEQGLIGEAMYREICSG